MCELISAHHMVVSIMMLICVRIFCITQLCVYVDKYLPPPGAHGCLLFIGVG